MILLENIPCENKPNQISHRKFLLIAMLICNLLFGTGSSQLLENLLVNISDMFNNITDLDASTTKVRNKTMVKIIGNRITIKDFRRKFFNMFIKLLYVNSA